MPDIRAMMTERNIELGAILRRARRANGLTQQECADYLTISRQRYGQMEAGQIMVTVVEFEALLDHLRVPFTRVLLSPSDKVREIQVGVPTSLEPGEIMRIILRAEDL